MAVVAPYVTGAAVILCFLCLFGTSHAICTTNSTLNASCPAGKPQSLDLKFDALETLPSRLITAVRSVYPEMADARKLERNSPEYLELFKKETSFYNRLVLDFFLPAKIVDSIPHFFQSWLRNFFGGIALYMVASTVWSVAVYNPVSASVFYTRGEALPSYHAMYLQICVAMQAMPIYTLLPTLMEGMVEAGWTAAYAQIEECSSPLVFIARLFVYLLGVEFCIYWIHRSLHDYKILYQYLHAPHHIYNKGSTLSPFAGLAFNPFDGVSQASPHVLMLFLVPMHFTTHLLLLFAEGIWTTNIHDNIHAGVFPIMGAGYHTIHHVTYRHNYGHYTVLFDWLFGTLRTPEEEWEAAAKRKERIEGKKSQ